MSAGVQTPCWVSTMRVQVWARFCFAMCWNRTIICSEYLELGLWDFSLRREPVSYFLDFDFKRAELFAVKSESLIDFEIPLFASFQMILEAFFDNDACFPELTSTLTSFRGLPFSLSNSCIFRSTWPLVLSVFSWIQIMHFQSYLLHLFDGIWIP